MSKAPRSESPRLRTLAHEVSTDTKLQGAGTQPDAKLRAWLPRERWAQRGICLPQSETQTFLTKGVAALEMWNLKGENDPQASWASLPSMLASCYNPESDTLSSGAIS